ncbi:MAG: hypothetical protein HFF88_09675, partial [Oscillibacter sp.]|jgi:hypothetical protein|nr:hypothetical protein [Oscillibacter sp.]
LSPSVFITIGFIGSVITMMQFAKYCGLLNKSRGLDPETVKHYQNMAQRYLAATGALLVVAVLSIIVGIFVS